MAAQPTSSTSTAPARRLPRPLRLLYDLFSNVWLGITLLILLFSYSSIGSAVPPFRQMRIFELTEFEWFHYWPFNLLIALICANIIVTTLRRIRFKPVNYGVWMIHSGILILCAGSLWYFGTKVEGESIVGRRIVTLSLPGAEPVSFAAQPGNGAEIENADAHYAVQVASIDPMWELLSGDDKGTKTYAVTMRIQRDDPNAEAEHDQQPNPAPVDAPDTTNGVFFMRQVIADYPQYTEDLVRTNDHLQPMKRAKKVNADGDPLIDKTLSITLAYQPETNMYVHDSAALYLRELNADGTPKSQWIERPINHLPRYHEYLSDDGLVFLPTSDPPPPIDPLHIAVPPDPDEHDPMPDTTVTVTDFLPYAMMDQRRVAGGDAFDPAVALLLSAADGRSAQYELVANDPQRSMAENGRLVFMWADSPDAIDKYRNAPGPRLSIQVPVADFDLTVPVETTLQLNAEAPFVPLGDTGYSIRVERIEDNLQINADTLLSIAMVQVRTPAGDTFRRLVHDDPNSPNADFPLGENVTGHEQPMPLHQSIAMQYLPSERPGDVTIIAGPQPDQLRILHAAPDIGSSIEPINVGDSIKLPGDLTLTVQRYSAHTHVVQQPSVIAQHRRDRDVGLQLAMMRVTVPNARDQQHYWLPFHLFAFENQRMAMHRFPYQPQQIALEDGRTIEMMYARARVPLPAPVVLDDFQLTTHTGGFTSDAAIRNWTSVVRFATTDGRYTQPVKVSVNEPIEYGGYWYFQSRWDAPDPPRGAGDPGSAGMNYTVLGIGNRHGVLVMLIGCCVAVIGMIYAFYVKPVIRRRRIAAVHEQASQRTVAASSVASTNGAVESDRPVRPREPVASSSKERQP